MKMKRKTVNYCLALLLFVFSFGMYQARQQHRNPFAGSTSIESPTGSQTVMNNTYSGNIKMRNKVFSSLEE